MKHPDPAIFAISAISLGRNRGNRRDRDRSRKTIQHHVRLSRPVPSTLPVARAPTLPTLHGNLDRAACRGRALPELLKAGGSRAEIARASASGDEAILGVNLVIAVVGAAESTVLVANELCRLAKAHPEHSDGFEGLAAIVGYDERPLRGIKPSSVATRTSTCPKAPRDVSDGHATDHPIDR